MVDEVRYWGRDVEQDGDCTLHSTGTFKGIATEFVTEPAPAAVRLIPFAAIRAVSEAVQEVEKARGHAEVLTAQLNHLTNLAARAEIDLDAAELELAEAQDNLV